MRVITLAVFQAREIMAPCLTPLPTTILIFAARYRTEAVEGGVPWLDYSLHPASKLGLHNALLAQHDRIEILQARGAWFECGVFVVRHGYVEALSQAGAERLFATLPHGDVKWIDLCRCMLPPSPHRKRRHLRCRVPNKSPCFHTRTPSTTMLKSTS